MLCQKFPRTRRIRLGVAEVAQMCGSRPGLVEVPLKFGKSPPRGLLTKQALLKLVRPPETIVSQGRVERLDTPEGSKVGQVTERRDPHCKGGLWARRPCMRPGAMRARCQRTAFARADRAPSCAHACIARMQGHLRAPRAPAHCPRAPALCFFNTRSLHPLRVVRHPLSQPPGPRVAGDRPEHLPAPPEHGGGTCRNPFPSSARSAWRRKRRP